MRGRHESLQGTPLTHSGLDAVRQILDECSSLSLATSVGTESWVATVFFASDSRLNLYFVSDRRTRHAQHLAENPRCHATVNPECAKWKDIRGLQIAGTAEVMDGPSRAEGLLVFLGRFADVKALFELPRSGEEQLIADRLKAADLYRLTPDWIRLIDNRRGFGYKEEFDSSQLRTRA